ncbi:MAG: polysaccharide deacetylase family protein [Verrucomicrobia bacterium]|nr:polysaccharide deacetylase family protein [Verrucomicrobiota bacterium]MBV9657345.1 polysaccharide deacetylase family protein [Verrucomicrobiota bacterium]
MNLGFLRFCAAGALLAGLSPFFIGNTLAQETAPSPSVEVSSVTTRERVVALTFDDGPHATFTPRLLDVLKAHGVKATFFVIGMNVEQNPDVLRRIAAEGHEIGNHTWSHPNLAKLPEEAWRAQLQQTNDVIVRTIGAPPRIVRPPYGDITPEQEENIGRDFHYRVVLWSVDPDDWMEPLRPILLRRVFTHAEPGSIVLLHDIHASTVDAMPALIEGLQKRGLRFVTVSELLALESPPQPPATAAAAQPPPQRVVP